VFSFVLNVYVPADENVETVCSTAKGLAIFFSAFKQVISSLTTVALQFESIPPESAAEPRHAVVRQVGFCRRAFDVADVCPFSSH
jgi:hypothetical protein